MIVHVLHVFLVQFLTLFKYLVCKNIVMNIGFIYTRLESRHNAISCHYYGASVDTSTG